MRLRNLCIEGDPRNSCCIQLFRNHWMRASGGRPPPTATSSGHRLRQAVKNLTDLRVQKPSIRPSVRPSVRPSLSLSGEWISIEWLVLTHSISPQLDQGDSLLSVNRKSGTSLGGVDSAEFSSARSTGEPGHWRGRSVAFMAHNGKASLGLHRWYFSYYRY